MANKSVPSDIPPRFAWHAESIQNFVSKEKSWRILPMHRVAPLVVMTTSMWNQEFQLQMATNFPKQAAIIHVHIRRSHSSKNQKPILHLGNETATIEANLGNLGEVWLSTVMACSWLLRTSATSSFFSMLQDVKS
jgi:hypothetical protein